MKLTVKILMFGLLLCSSLSAQIPERPNRRNADGERNGEWILWLDKEMNYRDFQEEGNRIYKPWYYALVTFVEGKPSDTVTIHYETGEVRWKGRMVKFDPFTPVDGQYLLRHKNGVTAAEFRFVHGQREGTEHWWYDTGAREWEKPYKNGKLNGIATQWYRNGKVRSEIPYVDGEINGTVRNWYESGVRESEIRYARGKREGMRIDYRKSGEKRAETPFVNDKVHGVVIEFYKSGVMNEAGSYENNQLNGTRDGYYESGVKKCECTYLNGEVHGYVKQWTEDGNLLRVQFYDHGRKVEQR
jgi:antitoxin component YwqK of YwqJK toxin-antitoxin module